MDFQSADLTGANLTGANLEGANLKVKIVHCEFVMHLFPG